MIAGEKPWWLILSGQSDMGKTHLLRGSFQAVKQHAKPHHGDGYDPRILVWPEIILALRSSRGFQTNDLLSDATNWRAVFLDELKADGDTTGYSTGILSNLLSARTGKWTMITTNLTLTQIEAVDARIASRMNRDGSRFLRMEGQRYCEFAKK